MNPHFPPTLDKILIVAMPGQRLEKRNQVYSRFVYESLFGSLGRKPTQEEVDSEIQRMHQRTFSEVESESIIWRVGSFANAVRKENLKRRAQAGGLALKAKREEEKTKKSEKSI
jgi:FKBP-type peptidyl-prolyl cis-trans isomerase (trigger factor)